MRSNSVPKRRRCPRREAESIGSAAAGAVEGALPCIKRIYGEYVSVKKFVSTAEEMASKAR